MGAVVFDLVDGAPERSGAGRRAQAILDALDAPLLSETGSYEVQSGSMAEGE